MTDDFDEPGLEDDGGVLDADEPVAEPPTEEELRASYPVDGRGDERPPEPDKLDSDPGPAPPVSHEPFIPEGDS